MTKFNPRMMSIARESRGLTQSGLADLIGCVPSFVSKLESGVLTPPDYVIERSSRALNYPGAFFFLEEQSFGLGTSFLYHRKRQSMPVPEQRRVQALANVFRIRVDRLLRGVDLEHANSFHPMDVDEFGGTKKGPAKIAATLRSSWKLPTGPVANLVDLIEAAGGIVIQVDFGNDKIDGCSLWVTGLPPIFFINTCIPGDRARFTLAHELGHVIMHRVPTEFIEEEADAFASEFLMPKRDIATDLEDMTLAKAAALKAFWRTSIAALVRRAKDLEVIPESRYRRLCTDINMAGYKKHEPGEFSQEVPSLLHQIIQNYLVEEKWSVDDLANLVVATPDDFVCTFMRSAGHQFRLVK